MSPSSTRLRTNHNANPPSTSHHYSSGADVIDDTAALMATPHDNSKDTNKRIYKLYWQRWVMLFYMSLLNLLSDWTCYSIAPISVLTDEAFGVIYPTALVVIFLFSNGLSTAFEPYILSLIGLRRMIVLGAFLGMVGSVLKSGIPFYTVLKEGDEWRVYIGFFLVGLSQPLYQCTPALLSASWFPEKERTMATGVALNANQLGIGCAFVFGSMLVKSADDIPLYFSTLSVLFIIAFLGTALFFKDRPPTPPSETARVIVSKMDVWYEEKGTGSITNYGLTSPVSPISPASPFAPDSPDSLEEESIWESIKACFAKPGFTHALASFTVSGIVINTLSTYMDYLINIDEDAGPNAVGIIGGSFQMLVMLSSLVIGYLTDKTRAYFSVVVGLLLLGAFALAKCGLYLDSSSHSLSYGLLSVAVLVGPLQPVATELGVDVTYPQCENTVLVVLQLFSNLCSSIFIPLFQLCRDVGEDRPRYLVSFYMLILLHATVTVYFATFEGRYRRLECELRRKGRLDKERMPLLGGNINAYSV